MQVSDPKVMKGKLLSRVAVFLLLTLSLQACKKEQIYTYEVEDVTVQKPGANKPNVKSDLELISIAYTDLFGNTIGPDQLEELVLAYQAFGDKRLVIDMLILNFLNDPGVVIPTASAMRADLDGFVAASFKKFFVREPSAFEQWYVRDMIARDTAITPDIVYYGFMTSNEYRHY